MFTHVYSETLRESIACYHQRQADINDYDSTNDDNDDDSMVIKEPLYLKATTSTTIPLSNIIDTPPTPSIDQTPVVSADINHHTQPSRDHTKEVKEKKSDIDENEKGTDNGEEEDAEGDDNDDLSDGNDKKDASSSSLYVLQSADVQAALLIPKPLW
jgi:hypothetical protein